MGLFLLWLYSIVGKPISIDIGNGIGKFRVNQITFEKKNNQDEIVVITLSKSPLNDMEFDDFLRAIRTVRNG